MDSKPDWMKIHGAPWVRESEDLVFDNPWLKISDFEARAPTGRKVRHVLVHFKALAIAVLPLHEDGTVTLVGQNRFPFAQHVWEIPEGGGPRHIPPLESARRELREETGLIADRWEQILTLQLSNSVTDEQAFGFLATGLRPGPADPDETEDLVLARVPFSAALKAAVSGHMQDALTVAMLLRCHHMAVTGELDGRLAQAIMHDNAG